MIGDDIDWHQLRVIFWHVRHYEKSPIYAKAVDANQHIELVRFEISNSVSDKTMAFLMNPWRSQEGLSLDKPQ